MEPEGGEGKVWDVQLYHTGVEVGGTYAHSVVMPAALIWLATLGICVVSSAQGCVWMHNWCLAHVLEHDLQLNNRL